MTARLASVVIKAGDPASVAAFWAHALRWNIRPGDGRDIELVPTDPTSFSILIQPASGEKVGQNRIHFDLTTSSPDDKRNSVSEFLSLGAKTHRHRPGSRMTRIMSSSPTPKATSSASSTRVTVSSQAARVSVPSTAMAHMLSARSGVQHSIGLSCGTKARRPQFSHPMAPARRSPGAAHR